MSDKTIALTIADRVGRLTFDRGAAGNAFTGTMQQEFEIALREAAGSADILVIEGAGPDFTIGRDRSEPKSDRGPFDAFRHVSATNEALATFPGITIAAIRGRAFGFGTGVIMRTDLAIASEEARFLLDEVKHGIAPMFIMEEILQHLPPKRALDIILTGREFGAREALEIGLVSRVVPAARLGESVTEIVQALRSRDPRVLVACKRYLRTVKDVPGSARSAFALVSQTRFAMESH